MIRDYCDPERKNYEPKENSDPHSNFIGGSNAAARIACPASWQLEQKLPPSARVESVYADEGSAVHAAIADALNNDLVAQDLLGRVYPPYEAHPITQELIDEAIAPCLEFFDKLEEPDSGPLEFYVEKRVGIPFLPGVFGTADLIGRTKTYSVVGDWKFGVGEKVCAWYDSETWAMARRRSRRAQRPADVLSARRDTDLSRRCSSWRTRAGRSTSSSASHGIGMVRTSMCPRSP